MSVQSFSITAHYLAHHQSSIRPPYRWTILFQPLLKDIQISKRESESIVIKKYVFPTGDILGYKLLLPNTSLVEKLVKKLVIN